MSQYFSNGNNREPFEVMLSIVISLPQIFSAENHLFRLVKVKAASQRWFVPIFNRTINF